MGRHAHKIFGVARGTEINRFSIGNQTIRGEFIVTETTATWGGKRPGAGRPRKAKQSPVEYALEVMRDPNVGRGRRDRMAIALLAAFGAAAVPEGAAGDADREAAADDA